MVVVLVLAQQTVIGAYISLQIGIVRPGGVYHDTLRSNFSPSLVAVILGKNQLV
jgi:hypothetical protein